MVLSNAKLIDGDAVVSIGISGGKITGLPALEENGASFTFNNAVAFPGLINSHDHLDFNLFPQLGGKIYDNYVEWGDYIQDNYRDEIGAVLKVPQNLRTQWGVYKNLLCGVTTVVNHGVNLPVDNPLITIFDRCQNLHSVVREKNWQLRLNNPLKAKIPAVIHIGEGTDISAFTEINELIRWTLLSRDIIGVHGVAMKPSQAADFKALVWCPQSNYFLLNKTAHIEQLKKHTQILFGTDSTLTSTWDAWDHIRMAQKTQMLTDGELYDSLTINPAKVWKLNSGKIAPGKNADIVIAKDKGGFCATECTDLLMVIHKGNIRLFDEEMYKQVCDNNIDITAYSKIYLGDSCKYVQGDLPGLIEQIKQYHPTAEFPVHANQPALIRLA
jgi:hypothetical protein